jgi:hypothetical protein
VYVVLRDPVAPVQHGEHVADLTGEIRGDGLGLLQHRHLSAQLVGDCGPHVKRWRHDHAVDVVPLGGRLGFRRRRFLGGLAAPLPGAADAEVDAAGMEGVEHGEALDDRGSRGEAQLHCGRADMDALGGGCDLADQYRRL